MAVTEAPQDDGVHGHQGPEPGKELSQGERESSPTLTLTCQCLKRSLAVFSPLLYRKSP